MPINIPSTLPARQTLERENVYLITNERAIHQDIRPLRIIILNLMPKKIETETQLLRLLGNTPLQLDIDLLQTATHVSRNTSSEHLLKFYKTFDEISSERYDGLIITGAPVEMMPFEEVDYWDELVQIMEWSKTHVYSTFHICWGAQAGVYYHYGIGKKILPQKMFGIFPHKLTNANHLLMRGFDEIYQVPHSRHTSVDEEALYADPRLDVLSYSDLSGINIAASHDCRHIFVFGHFEYDRRTLADEYFRDRDKGMEIQLPYHYFPEDDPSQRPPFIWRGHANLLYKNWINIVYQQTPYDLDELEHKPV